MFIRPHGHGLEVNVKARFKLKWKLFLFSSILLITLIAVIGSAAIYVITERTKQIFIDNQQTLLNTAAKDLEDKLTICHNSLTALANSFEASTLFDPAAVQHFLDNSVGTGSLFDQGLLIFTSKGFLVAESPYFPNRRGNSFSYADYIQETIKTRKPYVSRPFISNRRGQTISLMFTAPIFDERGDLVAILGGSIGLSQPGILENIVKAKLGKTGYYVLATNDGLTILHPYRDRLMLPLFPHRSGDLWKYTQKSNIQSSEVFIDGVPSIVSFIKFEKNDWVMGIVYSDEELKEMVASFKEQWLRYVVIATFIALIAIWMVIEFLTRPLTKLAGQLSLNSGTPVTISTSDEIGSLASAHNIVVNDLLTKDRNIQDREQRYRLIADNSYDMVITLSSEGIMKYVSPASTSLIGYPQELLEGHSIYEFINPADIPFLQKIFDEILSDPSAHKSTTCRFRHSDNVYIWIEISSKQSSSEGSTTIVSVCRDITTRKELEDHLQYLACHDTLTGLPNRFSLLDRFVNAVNSANRDGHSMVIMVMDLDRFKNINDTLGHISGDQILQATAERFKTCLRESDILARPGGDEFVALLPIIHSLEHSRIVADKILAAFDKPFIVGTQKLHLTTSIGVSTYPSDGEDLPTLLKNADTALYRAKAAGGDAVVYYKSDMNALARQRLLLENSLHNAIEGNELRVHYQPILSDSKVIGMEALVRWQHPQSGLVNPSEFISIAEDCGLIIPIGEWVLRTACAQAVEWRNSGISPLKLSVNVSARQFRQHNLPETIKSILDQTGFNADSLCLEITESTVMENPEKSGAILASLKALGVSISIDDFGTGYSSLAYLKRFPIDVMKIDRSFVKEIAHSQNDPAIVKAVITLAHSLGLTVVAEGVETQEQLDFLIANHCDAMQGYFYSRPLPEEQFFEYLAKSDLKQTNVIYYSNKSITQKNKVIQFNTDEHMSGQKS